MTEESNSRVNYLDEKILKEICHELARELFEEEEPMGLYEDHDKAKVDSCLNLPRQAAFGEELYPGIFKKAAITFYAFNRNHAFGNGNKRLSVMAFAVFLYINNLAIEVEPAELRDKALWLAQTNEPIDKVVKELADWGESNCISVSELESRK